MRHVGALILVNSNSPYYHVFSDYIRPYLKQWGIYYQTIDLANERSIPSFDAWSLTVLGHAGCLSEVSTAMLEKLSDAVSDGSGLVSLGESVSPWSGTVTSHSPSDTIRVKDICHPVSRLHDTGERRLHFSCNQCITPTTLAQVGEHLAYLGDTPVLSCIEARSGRVCIWSSLDWANPEVLGPLYGLDDLLWRSLVWAARKPFLLRPVPPFVTMRVDDVSGFGRKQGGPSDLYWVKDAVELGWKPWLGLFLDDLRQESIDTLKPLIDGGSVTACPHAFSYWDFIYFNHREKDGMQGYMALSNDSVEENVHRVNAWYDAHGNLPKSKVFIPHFYEFTSAFAPHLKEWGIEYMCSAHEPDRPYPGKFALGAPYFTQKLPGTNTSPVYYADWYPIPKQPEYDRAYFTSVTEIRDDNEYEWAPNNDVDATIQHAITQIRRGLDSNVLAQLFTHESDFIQYIKPERWRLIMEGVTEYVHKLQARLVTLDHAMAYLRDLNTSTISCAEFTTDSITVHVQGSALGPTQVVVYRESERLEGEWMDIRPFEEAQSVVLRLS